MSDSEILRYAYLVDDSKSQVGFLELEHDFLKIHFILRTADCDFCTWYRLKDIKGHIYMMFKVRRMLH